MTPATMTLALAERHFLALIANGGSIAVGSATGASLYRQGLVELVRGGRRYKITALGRTSFARAHKPSYSPVITYV